MASSIGEATGEFESWLRHQLPSVDEKGLIKKHQKMRKGAFEFLRATFYRWMQRWPEIAGDLDKCPRILAVGDLHVENFGTWRDAEGRLVWGINDFDEAYSLPYSLDLVRLATSVLFVAERGSLNVGSATACSAILKGYADGMEEGGEPIVLSEPKNDWLRRVAQSLWEPWESVEELKNAKRIPAGAKRALKASAPEHAVLEFRKRRAGLGSLGKPRFVAKGIVNGGRIAREAKAVTPSACAWVLGETTMSRTMAAVQRAVRAPDPFYAIFNGWLVRRLARDCGKLELDEGDRPEHAAGLLEYMGRETANVHLGTRAARGRIRADLGSRKPAWLERAAERAFEIVTADWKAWRRALPLGGEAEAG